DRRQHQGPEGRRESTARLPRRVITTSRPCASPVRGVRHSWLPQRPAQPKRRTIEKFPTRILSSLGWNPYEGRIQTHRVQRRVRRSTLLAFVAVGVAIGASVSAAQFGQYRGRSSFGRGLTFATSDDFNGGFQFCRIAFRTASNGDGNGWDVDWPR